MDSGGEGEGDSHVPPGYISEEEVSKALNLIERTQAAFGVTDEALAVYVANLIQMGRVERQQNEMLTALVEAVDRLNSTFPETSVDEVGGALGRGLSGDRISFPTTARKYGLPAAPRSDDRISVDLESGYIRLPGASGLENLRLAASLDELEVSHARAAHLWLDTDVSVFFYDREGVQRDVISTETAGWVQVQGTQFSEVRLQADVPFQLRAQFSTSALNPQAFESVSDSQSRFGYADTSDALQTVPMVPPTASDYEADTKEEAAAEHGEPVLRTAGLAQCTAIIENVGDNDADYQLRTRHQGDERWVADHDVHNTVEDDPEIDTAAIQTVDAGEADVIETGINTDRKQLRVMSTDSGNHTTLRVQWQGYAPGLR